MDCEVLLQGHRWESSHLKLSLLQVTRTFYSVTRELYYEKHYVPIPSRGLSASRKRCLEILVLYNHCHAHLRMHKHTFPNIMSFQDTRAANVEDHSVHQ